MMSEDYEQLAKVAQVIDRFTFVINDGANDSVTVGQHYLIFRLGDTILDPDTGDNLGRLEVVVGRARVTHVQERIATLESAETQIIPGTVRRIKRQGSGLLSALGGVPNEEEVEEGRETSKAPIEVLLGDFARRL